MSKAAGKNRRRDKHLLAIAKAAANGRTETVTRNPPPCDLDLTLTWYLVYTSPRMEGKAQKALDEAGCKTFWPSSHKVVTQPRRKPLEFDVGTFPRYLFVAGMPFRQRKRDHVNEDRSVVTIDGCPIDDIRDIDGVEYVVGTSAGWLKVPSAAIAAIAGFQARKEAEKAAPKLRRGDKATVISGPFMSFQATVVEAIGLHEARVLIEIFGGEVPATIGVASLQAA